VPPEPGRAPVSARPKIPLWGRRLFTSVAAVAVWLGAVGCWFSPHTSPTPAAPTPANAANRVENDVARTVAIAREAVDATDTWVDRATLEARREGSGWSVIVWREPRVVGGHRLVQIDQTGKVTSYLRGH